MVDKTALSPHDLAILDEPTLASQLPVTFDNGAQWQQISSSCAECGEYIGPDAIRARLTRVIPTVISMDALAHCAFCDLWTPVRYRFRDDMSFDGRIPGGGGAWGKWLPRREGRLRSFLRRIGILDRSRTPQ